MITVVIPTRNPDECRLSRVLAGLAIQTAPESAWELVVVDNGSAPALRPAVLTDFGERARIVQEPSSGLTPARLTGIRAARGEIVVFADDDNVLCPGYLAAVARHFDHHPRLGTAGGPVLPEWEMLPPTWSNEFHGLLALRDLGPEIRVTSGGPGAAWPSHAPVGAGLAVRRSFALAYAEAVASDPRRRGLDRKGGSLASGGDNDLVFTALHAGGDVGYFPDLKLTHLIPAGRLNPDYLARLNRGIMRSWVLVLALHGQCPWKPIDHRTVWLRAARAWWRCHAWRGAAQRIRFAGMLGQFEGQADLKSLNQVSS